MTGGRVAALQLRTPVATDHEAIARLLTRSNPLEPPVSAEEVAWSYGRADPARPKVRLVAERGQSIVGSGFLRGIPMHAGLLLNLEVDPLHRGQGVGTRLFAAMLRAKGSAGLPIWTVVSEADAASLSFAAHHAFRQRDRVFESVLDLCGFDPTLHADARASAVERGIRFASLAAEDSPTLRRRVHALSMALSADVPSVEEIGSATYAEWVAGWLESPYARPDLLAIAFDGDAPVALSYVTVGPDGTGFNHMTGVLPGYRGRQLGLAVKVEALRLAKECGVMEVRTNNHSGNGSMLAINARLGYRRLVGYIEFVRA